MRSPYCRQTNYQVATGPRTYRLSRWLIRCWPASSNSMGQSMRGLVCVATKQWSRPERRRQDFAGHAERRHRGRSGGDQGQHRCRRRRDHLWFRESFRTMLRVVTPRWWPGFERLELSFWARQTCWSLPTETFILTSGNATTRGCLLAPRRFEQRVVSGDRRRNGPPRARH